MLVLGISVYRWLVQSDRMARFNNEFVYRPNFTARSQRERIVVQQITDGLSYPWGVAVLPGQDAVLITEKFNSVIKRVNIQNGEQQAIARIGAVSPLHSNSHCGLLDISVHPQFSENNYIYLAYTIGTESQGTVRPQIARARYVDHSLQELTPLLTVAEGSSSSGTCGLRFAWHTDGSLFVSVGHDNSHSAQDKGSLRGKIIRIHDDGTIPKDNPFVGQAGVREEIYSLGHRDPQGLTISTTPPYTVWSNEHGPYGGDELNVIVPGGNYGWPVVSYGVKYVAQSKIAESLEYIGIKNRLQKDQIKAIGNGTHAEAGFIEPVAHWGAGGTRSIAPSGMLLYSGNMFAQWKGNILIATLYKRHIRRLEVTNNRVTHQEKVLNNKLGRVRHLVELDDGSILVITDSPNGRLFRLSHK